MSSLGEINKEIMWRKSRAALLQAVLQHLDSMYVANDAGEAELTLNHEDGGVVTEEHIERFMDEVTERLEAECEELDRICDASIPELQKLLLPPDPEPDPDPESDGDDEGDGDEGDGEVTEGAEDVAGDEAEAEEGEPEEGDDTEADDVEDEEEGEEDEPSAQAS